jgi:nucleoside-diphosphate-sugar epimerase
VALGGRTNLKQLHRALVEGLERLGHEVAHPEPHHGPFRDGDVRHSLADVSAARDLLGYAPAVSFEDGLQETIAWFARAAQPAR